MAQPKISRYLKSMASWRIISIIIMVLFVVLGYHYYRQSGISLVWLQEQRVHIEHLIMQRYALCVLVYILGFIVSVLLGLPITILLIVASGYFFGVFWGVVYSNIGATLGACAAFLFFRILGSLFIGERSPRLEEFNRSVEQYGANYLLMMQFLPITPNFMINIFAGLTSVRLWTFMWTTSVGILPASLIYAFAGRELAYVASLHDILSWPMMIALALLALLACAPIVINRIRSGKE